MNKKIIVTGATGLIGKKLVNKLIELNYKVKVFSRNPVEAKKQLPKQVEVVYWNDYENKNYSDELKGVYGVIHLAGANIAGQKWTENYKNIIYKSREITTRILASSVNMLEDKPEVFISSSAIGIYGNRGDEILDESSTIGNNFLSDVCEMWERESAAVDGAGVRRVNIRTGIVLSTEGGALKKLLLPFKCFVGGALGKGTQWFSWVHIDDIVSLYIYSLENNKVTGAVNGTAPFPLPMNEFASALGKALNRPSLFNVPEFILKLILGEGAEAVLSSQRVMPKKAVEYGFQFNYPKIEDALFAIVKKAKM